MIRTRMIFDNKVVFDHNTPIICNFIKKLAKMSRYKVIKVIHNPCNRRPKYATLDADTNSATGTQHTYTK